MNKKLKKILATISAVVMCAVPMTAIYSNAVVISSDENLNISYIEDNTMYSMDIPLDTQSFTYNDEKFIFWQEATDYMKRIEKCYSDIKIYRKEGTSGFGYGEVVAYLKTHKYYAISDELFHVAWSLSAARWHSFALNKDKADILEKYLSDKNIDYSIKQYDDDDKIYINIDNLDNRISIYIDILENTDLKVGMAFMDEVVTANSVEISLPEPTLTGDVNEDGNITIADSVLILQSLSSPDDYKLTIQGIANADMDGDGVTAADALRIQEMLANK